MGSTVLYFTLNGSYIVFTLPIITEGDNKSVYCDSHGSKFVTMNPYVLTGLHDKFDSDHQKLEPLGCYTQTHKPNKIQIYVKSRDL